jgi:hypothetical protein
MSEAVFSESLAYASMKKRSVSARSFRTKIAPSNGSTFAADSTIQIDLPGNLQSQYFDFSSMYLKFKLTSDLALHLDRGGAFGLFKRLQLSVAGAQLADINSYGVLCTAMLDTSASAEWKAGFGNICAGTIGDALTGVAQAAGAGGARVYCVPIVLNPLFNTTGHRLIPAFSLSAIQMRLQIDSAASCVVVSGAADPVLAFSEVELCCMMTELSPQAQVQVDAACGGNYTILANSFMNSQATLALNETQLTANLGFSVSSLERIIAVHRPTATIAARGAYSLGNRTTSGLVQYKYLINAESYPQRDVVVGDHGAESTAEMLIADHALVDFNKGSALNNGVVVRTATGNGPMVGSLGGIAPEIAKSPCFMLKDGAGTIIGLSTAATAALGDSNIGTFMISTDFENGLSVGKSSSIYSGVSTIASSVQWLGTYSNAHAAAQVDFFACFSVLMTLNTRGSGVWQISV